MVVAVLPPPPPPEVVVAGRKEAMTIANGLEADVLKKAGVVDAVETTLSSVAILRGV